MTTLDKDQADISADSAAAAGNGSAAHASEHRHHRTVSALHELRRLERRAIELPIVGKLHAPDAHDVAYAAGWAALLVFGAVELPIALVVLGGHALVKQHHSRSLSAIGEVMEEAWGHQV